MDRIRLSVTNLGCPDWPLQRFFGEAQRLGYEGVELRCLEGGLLTPAVEPRVRQEIVRLSAATGLPVIAVGASSRFSSPDAAERALQEQDLRGMIDLAVELGAPVVRAYGGPLPVDELEEVVCARIAASVARVAEHAAACGVDIALETHDGLSSARVARAVLAHVPHPRVHALWDVLHPTRMGETPEQVWGWIGSRVCHVHLKDARRGPDGRWRAVVAGEGDVPLRRCLEVLWDQGYRGWITLEWEKYWEPEIAPAEIALPSQLVVVRRWIDEVCH